MKERINFIIEKLNISKAKFAERINISQAFTSQLCSGAREPSDRTIQDICREFGCNEVWLRTGEGEPFRKSSREEEIMRFAVQTYKSPNEFRKAFVAMLARLDPEDWDALERIADKLLEEYKGENDDA